MNKAQAIRNELKAIGISAKQVSVTSTKGSVSMRIKDFCIDAEVLEAIGNKYEDISYCQFSQEILSGGNFFVSVSYDWEVEARVKKSSDYLSFLEEIKNKANELGENNGVSVSPNATLFRHQKYGFQISAKWTDRPWVVFANIDAAAFYLYTSRLQGKY